MDITGRLQHLCNIDKDTSFILHVRQYNLALQCHRTHPKKLIFVLLFKDFKRERIELFRKENFLSLSQLFCSTQPPSQRSLRHSYVSVYPFFFFRKSGLTI